MSSLFGNRRAEKRHERDRIQWSDVYKRALNTLAKGTGEAYVEGVYFGLAYATPPFFEFAAVRAGENPPTIKSRGFSHPRAKIAPEPRGNTGQYDSWFLDGSFEFHGMWDDYIVTWDDYNDGYQKIWADDPQNDSNFPWSYKWSASNHWVQQPSHNRWSVSSERAHKHDIGASGSYSAKFTHQSDGEIGPWLVPIEAAGEYNPWDFTPDLGDQHYGLISYALQMNYSQGYNHPTNTFYPEGGFNNPGLVNPINEGMDHEVWLYSDQPYTFEVWVTVWDDEEFNPDIGIWHQEQVTYRDEWPMKGGDWEKVEWTVRMPSRLMPGMPTPLNEDGSFAVAYERGYWGTCRMRVKGGNKGQSVFLDDCCAWSHLNFNENPYITVGVAKWIRDENGAYVGADLWVKIGEVGFQVNP
jgi:hypothetical protein